MVLARPEKKGRNYYQKITDMNPFVMNQSEAKRAFEHFVCYDNYLEIIEMFFAHQLGWVRLELMVRGGMRVGEVLNLTAGDIQERSLTIQKSKSGRVSETVYVPRKIQVRLNDYVKVNHIAANDRIFSISCVAALPMVRKSGKMVDIELRPYDLRRHAATFALRSSTPTEVVSKVIYNMPIFSPRNGTSAR